MTLQREQLMVLKKQWKLVLGGLVIAALMLLPFWVMIVTSLMGKNEVFSATPSLIPKSWHWENYLRIFDVIPIDRYFWNSLFVSGVTTVLHVLCCAMAAYAFSRLPLPRKNLLFFVFLIFQIIVQ